MTRNRYNKAEKLFTLKSVRLVANGGTFTEYIALLNIKSFAIKMAI